MPAATPSSSVRYGSRSNPGTVPNVPVATLPQRVPAAHGGAEGHRATVLPADPEGEGLTYN
jgi:hypothetical protein